MISLSGLVSFFHVQQNLEHFKKKEIYKIEGYKIIRLTCLTTGQCIAVSLYIYIFIIYIYIFIY